MLKNQKGQSLVEYLILVAIIAVATMGILRVMGQTISSRFATITYSLQGTKRSVEMESIDEGLYKKKDLGDFLNGSAGRD